MAGFDQEKELLGVGEQVPIAGLTYHCRPYELSFQEQLL